MTMDLINISKQTVGEEEINAVDARELWRFLESKRQFGNWIQAKVINNPFFEKGTDWEILNKSVKAQQSTSLLPEYAKLTVL